MPYRLKPNDGRCVQVKRGDQWQDVKCHETPAKAAKHLAALRINVEERVAFSAADEAMRIEKIDRAHQVIGGWGYVAVKRDGTVMKDLHGHRVTPEELEHASWEFVESERLLNEMHRGESRPQLVACVAMTPEKYSAMKIDPAGHTMGVWIEYRLTDEQWAKYEAGAYPMFSMEGSAVEREEAA